METVIRALGLFLVFVFGCADSVAQSYPAKPIRIIVPFSAGGGGNDFRARVIGEKLNRSWGQQVVIENRPGADGAIGAEAVARAAPDGYTLLQNTPGISVVNPVLYKKLRYNPMEDFAHVTQLITTTIVLVVTPSLPVKSVKELVALAKSKPGQINYATSASVFYLVTEMFKLSTGIDMAYIPYKGDSPAITALITGETPVMFNPILALLTQIKANRARPLAVAGANRSSTLPDVPTMSEAGIPDFEISTWSGISVPAGTPREIVTKLSAEIAKILRMPDVKERLESGGDIIVGSTPEEFTAFIKADLEKFRNVVRDANISRID